MPVRMKDIARDLGVSIVTVSKALRNNPEISEATTKRVLQRVKELDYQPDHAARSLVTGKTHMIGLVVPDLVHPFFAEVAKGASRVLRENGYGLVLSSSEQDPEVEQLEIRQMLGRGLDVLMVASSRHDLESFRYLERHQKSYVLLDRRYDGLNANFVGTDDVAVGRIATKHLIELGRKRIAHLGGSDVSTGLDRVQGYRETLQENGMEVRSEYVIMDAHNSAYMDMKALLAMENPPDAVFCYNDPIAMAAMEAVLEAGLRVPQDVAIIGCGNVNWTKMLRVPLSSIDQNTEELGEKAAHLVLTLARSKGTSPLQSVLLQPRLIARESTLGR